MIFWIVMGIGVVLSVLTSGKIYVETSRLDSYMTKGEISQTSKETQRLLHFLVCLCIILLGGNAVALFGSMFHDQPFWMQTLAMLVPAILTYFVGYNVLELSRFDSKKSQVLFLVIFILSIYGWLIPIQAYNKNIEKIEYVKTIEWAEQRELLYFCNIPVQNVSGKIDGSTGILGGGISGEISTTDELTYWYAGADGRGMFDKAQAIYSSIEFIENEEKPYVEITGCHKCDKHIDHNFGLEIEMEKNSYDWIEWVFYLPKSLMNSSLN